jgi:predicted ATPase
VRIRFELGKSSATAVRPGELVVLLRSNSWNDYGFGTTFELMLRVGGEWIPCGVVKIGRRNQRLATPEGNFVGTQFVKIPGHFERLSDEYFSLGQDADYYDRLVVTLGTSDATKVLTALRDVAVVPGLFEEVADEEVLRVSLMRSVSTQSLRRYREIVRGRREKRDFSLTYSFKPGDPSGPHMVFRVERSRKLPSNVHVLIGSNGTGKTTALSNIRLAFQRRELNEVAPEVVQVSDQREVAGLLSIGFSAFDTFPALERGEQDQLRFRITNVRLPWLGVPRYVSEGASVADTRRAQDIEMGAYVRSETLGCLAERAERLLPALRLLAEADPVLDRHQISSRIGLERLDYASLSSGHKIAILTIATLVRYSEEKTLVLLDEPESHLHPPLLGAVTRALSDVMTSINGLAIVATHSPVVLQEVPRRCAWVIWSSGGESRVERPSIETFGANLGVLTRELFDLELSKSGYHALLRRVADNSTTYEEAVNSLGGELGDEARMLLRSMMRRVGD